MTANDIKEKFINYFKNKNHHEIKNASLIPENDASVLFTTAGMHPLVPYLLGEKHPFGKRLVNIQRCLRTADIESVGNDTHLTFFEMLGNWSLGDYFKEDAINMSYDFLINHLNLDLNRIVVTVFKGDEVTPQDDETAQQWLKLGIPQDKIIYYGKKDNWWGPVGLTGPCGPDTEIFYDTLKPKCSKECGPSCSCGKYIEIWNNVFMEYNQLQDGTLIPLKQKNVDTGMGLERIILAVNNQESVYESELFKDIIAKIEMLSQQKYQDHKRTFRIIADHLKAATFILGDEKKITPSNTDQGYVLRRLIRRACRYLKKLNIAEDHISQIALVIINQYQTNYKELQKHQDFIISELEKEIKLFNKTLSRGLKEFLKMTNFNITTLSGDMAFKLYDTYGFPLEMTIELSQEKNINVDVLGFHARFKQHQELSRVGAAKKFSGGLADHSIETTKLHTATHLLHAALRKVLGNTVYQKGSNITAERLRFDFSFARKLTPAEIKQVEVLVNDMINQKIDLIIEEKSLEEAKQDKNIIGLFETKYENKVNIYRIGNFSAEICGGPHVSNTSELGTFKIIKEESSSAGVRRIKAILQ